MADLFVWLFDQLYNLVMWVLDWFVNLIVEVFVAPLLDVILFIFSSIPLPAWWTAGNFSLGGAGYYMSLFQIPTGVSIAISAYLIRFLIRRIPLFG